MDFQISSRFNKDALDFSWKQDEKNNFSLHRFQAGMVSTGLQGILERLDPSKITLISKQDHKRVYIQTKQLADYLRLSILVIVLLKYSPFKKHSLENRLNNKLLENVKITERIFSIAQNHFKKNSHQKSFKISKKQHQGLTHSYLATKKGDRIDIYQHNMSSNKQKVIGEGSFKRAKSLTHLLTNREFVLAVPHKNVDPQNGKEKLKEELKTHKQTKNIPHIAKGKKITWIGSDKQENLGILMPRYSYTMESARNQLNLIEKEKCSLDIAYGIRDLFEKDLLHFDLKPANLFIEKQDGEFHAYVGDLGGIRKYTSLFSDAKTFVYNAWNTYFGQSIQKENNIMFNGIEHTFFYAAPEIGALIPYSKEDLKKAIIYSIGKTFLDWHYEKYSNPLKLNNLIEKMTSTDPKERPGIDEIILTLEKICITQAS